MQPLRYEITVAGYRLHMIELGSGPAVLLLHGFVSSAEEWLATLPVLAKAGYRAVAVDALGFGRSDKPVHAPYGFQLQADLYAGLMDALDVPAAALMAHSMGGKYAIATALLHPARVRALVLVDTDGFVEPSPMIRVGGLPVIGEIIVRLSAQPAVVRSMLNASFHNPHAYVSEDAIARGVATLRDPAQRRALVAFSRRYHASDLRRTGLRARLSTLRCPTLVVWGAEDRIFPVSLVSTITAEIPGARAEVLPGVGHVPQIEATAAFHRVVVPFLHAHVAAPGAP